ncbi:unnamed protein product [Effrenium voratum]|nr:unnamed protein product [Effrenium voratum]
MTSLYPQASLTPLLPGPQAVGTQKAQEQECARRRVLLSCHVQDLLSASTETGPARALVIEKGPAVPEPLAPGLLDEQQLQRSRLPERATRDPAERKASLRRVVPHTWDPWPTPEPSLAQQPLLMLGDHQDSLGAQRVLLWDETRRCFAAHWPALLPADFCSHSFEALMAHGPWEPLHSKKGQVTRETCWYVRGGCRCDYTYGIARVRAKRKQTSAFRAAMEMLLTEVMGRMCPWLPKEAWPNCANLNLYTEAYQSVGWHADDESLFLGRDKDCPIISVSLGARREFWLGLRHEGCCMDPQLKSILEVDLCNGDILTMEGLCQKHCVHFVPCDVRNVAAEAHRARINVTWRWIRDHKQRCAKRLENSAEFFFETHGSPRPARNLSVATWAGQRALAWRTCDECDHDAWRGGRNCVRHQKQWLCRLCFEHMLSGAPPQLRLHARERGPRRPGQRVVEARAAAEAEAEANPGLPVWLDGRVSAAHLPAAPQVSLPMQPMQMQEQLCMMQQVLAQLEGGYRPACPASLYKVHPMGPGSSETKVSYYPDR